MKVLGSAFKGIGFGITWVKAVIKLGKSSNLKELNDNHVALVNLWAKASPDVREYVCYEKTEEQFWDKINLIYTRKYDVFTQKEK